MTARVVVSLDGEILSEVELAKAVTVVGRHPDCDIVIDHPAISGRHLLFRVVGRTVYVEDLASTNGTRVNGIVTDNRVVKHLDLIEAGKHKLHFFENARLAAGGMSDLESTVQNDYERTQMVEAPAASAPAAHRGGEDLARTMVIQRDPKIQLGPAQEMVRTGEELAAGTLALRMLDGPRAGQLISLDRANTMIGTPGGDTALVVKRGPALFLARFSGNNSPRVNRHSLGPGTHPIGVSDVIEVGGLSFEVVVK